MGNNKPSWDDAPGWVNWLAQDGSGEWYGYSKRPEVGRGLWVSPYVGRVWLPPQNEPLVPNPGWRNAIERRPTPANFSTGVNMKFEDVVDTAKVRMSAARLGLEERSRAWYAVFELLQKLDPSLLNRTGSGLEVATQSIQAAFEKAAKYDKIKEALDGEA